MKRTLGDTWWTELRWRIALKVLIWAVKIAPYGDAKGNLIDSHLQWIREAQRQWKLRYPENV